MFRGILFAAVCAGLMWGNPAAADGLDGNKLLRICKARQIGGSSARAIQEEAFCLGYVAAISHVLLGGDEINGISACPPADADGMQLIEVAIKWLEENSSWRHYWGKRLVALALSEEFRCIQDVERPPEAEDRQSP